ncbi:MAG TPA: ATPase P [Ruminococcaceae bacterium]|nr:ATPase P [Oscillospiraceae bacterium]
MLFYKQFYMLNMPIQPAVVSTVAATIGMIPEGLMLLTSVALAVGVIKLAKHSTLVQELYCLETLARTDMLCLDKTGTITNGEIAVSQVIEFNGADSEYIFSAMNAIVKYSVDDNSTAKALKQFFSKNSDWRCVSFAPFSSARKHSVYTFENEGTFYLGAAEFILKEQYDCYKKAIEEYTYNASRAILLAHSKTNSDIINPIAIIALHEEIRENAAETIEYFYKQGVNIKIISGDDPRTVSQIAKKAGVVNYDKFIDAVKLNEYNDILECVDKYTVFGRVTPEQKKQIVMALKNKGYTVAMTGDGVNDILALKEADCSIAMNSGSDAAKSVSQLVLLNSDFSSMPCIVAEGRRVINNIQRASSLFLVKTIFSFVLAVITIFLEASYPFIPIQLTLISTLTIGIPSFFLALEPNENKISGKFLKNILQNALPGALTIVVSLICIIILSKQYSINNQAMSTIAVIITAISCFGILFKVCSPFNFKRAAMLILLISAFVISILFFGDVFSLVSLNMQELLLLCLIAVLIFPVYTGINYMLRKLNIVK